MKIALLLSGETTHDVGDPDLVAELSQKAAQGRSHAHDAEQAGSV